MSKLKVTRKYLKDNYNCISVGYCDLYYLFNCVSPNYYTCGVYGWNFDAYTVYHKKTDSIVCITTGYRGMIDNCQNNNSHELERKYNEFARQIVNDIWDFDSQKNALEKLQQQYLDEVFA